MKFYTVFTSLCLLFFFLGPWSTQAQNSNPDAELEQLAQLLTGEFDNFQQLWIQKEAELPDSLHIPHLHLNIKSEPLPPGRKGKLLLAEYTLQQDEGAKEVKYTEHFYLEPQGRDQIQIRHYRDPTAEEIDRVVGMESELLDAVPDRSYDCRLVDGQWQAICTGPVDTIENLSFTSEALILPLPIPKLRSAANRGLFPTRQMTFKRCQFFQGWMAVQKAADSEDYYVMRNIRLHDQGLRVRLIDVSGEATPYFIELSKVIYRGGIEVLKLAIYEEGKTKAPAYVWTNPEASRIGINMRSMTAGFTIVE